MVTTETACAECGAPAKAGARYCGVTCRHRHRDRKRQDAAREKQHAVSQTCNGCGVVFHGRRRRFCTAACRVRFVDASEARQASKRAWHQAHPASGNHRKPRTCEVCGGEYRPTYQAQRTCGRKCGIELRRSITGTLQPKGTT